MKRAVKFSLVLSVAAIGLVYYFVQVRTGADIDVSANLRAALNKSNSGLLIDDLAKDLSQSTWSSVCAVLPYANANLLRNAPEALREEPWVGNWDESEWRLVFLDSDEVGLVATIQYESVRIALQDPSGIACFPRSQQPTLRKIENQSAYELTLRKG